MDVTGDAVGDEVPVPPVQDAVVLGAASSQLLLDGAALPWPSLHTAVLDLDPEPVQEDHCEMSQL